ncbi:hypothetical protein EJK17_00375 [Lactobacillus xujianguonis]|uniref:Uncharacterized protein n=1 Tax=Lactobacillus xujianguonis TaxID=2495899 RepID=A0A437SY77_9LACO|nr:hypothetical protein EJK17_00375 [Lactobacillus xujianguonis]
MGVVSVNGIGYILTAIGSLITAVTLFYKAFNSSKQNSFAKIIEEKDEDLKRKSQDAELYRKRWLKAEAENDKLRKELNDRDN